MRKAVLVVGGSGGIGAAVCRLAAERSWDVFVGFRSGVERAMGVAEGIGKAGGRAWPVRLDLTDADAQVAAAMDAVAREGGRLDAVVLCASPAPALGPFTKADAASFQAQLDANVVGVHALLTAVWRRFFKGSGGRLVAVSSRLAETPPKPQMAAYVVGKRALVALLECAERELGASGLRVSVVSAGYTDTPMLRALHPHIVEAARATQAGGRFLSPEEVAREVVACLDAPPAEGVDRRSVSNDA